MNRQPPADAASVSGAVPDRAFPPAVIRAWDRDATQRYGLPSITLMENAGAGAARIIRRLAARGDSGLKAPYTVVCGPGNNGGDGFVVARHLHNAGEAVDVIVLGDRPYPEGSDARIHRDVAERMGIGFRETAAPPGPDDIPARGTVIDGIFGTGLSRRVASPFAEWIDALARAGLPVIALDIPSGLDAETGEVLGAALAARATITFAARKTGFERARGPELCGEVFVVDIGLPSALWRRSGH